jgi:peptidoglycan hydrolase FlgJ
MDLIADVMKRADPLQQRAAIAKLEEVAASRVTSHDVPAFKQVVKEKDQSRLQSEVITAQAKAPSARQAAMKKLEAVLATKFVEAMLPKDQSSLYGEGTSGEVWRGLHIEAMGKALADGGLLDSPTVSQAPAQGLRKAITPFAG